MSEWLAWAAGIIDGEGCIHISHKAPKYGRMKSHQYVLVVEVSNTDPRMLTKLQVLFGGSIHPIKPQRSSFVKKPFWRWGCSSKTAAACLQAIRPWLVVKGDQADIGLESRKYLGVGSPSGMAPNVVKLAVLKEQLHALKRVVNT